eukprot:gene5335-7404_t
MDTSGYFSLEIQDLSVNLSTQPLKDISLRLDVEISNGYDVFKWNSTDKPTFSTDVLKLVQQNVDQDSSIVEDAPLYQYALGFNNGNGIQLRTNYIDLNNEVINGITNAVLMIKMISIYDNQAGGAAAPPKGKKNDAVPEKPSEEIFIQIAVPLSLLSVNPSIDFSNNFDLTQYSDTDIVMTVGSSSSIVSNKSYLNWKLVTDNDFAMYSLGSKIIKWSEATITSIPNAWALKSPDVIDPKAKAPPTAEELRKKYLENILRLITTQDKVAKFQLFVGYDDNFEEGISGEDDNEGSEEKDASFLRELFPNTPLGNGLIKFDIESANLVPLNEDIRSRMDLWSIQWSDSSLVSIHRNKARKFVELLKKKKNSSQPFYLPITIKKIPTPEGASVEGKPLVMTGKINILPIIEEEGGVVQYDLQAQIIGTGVEGEDIGGFENENIVPSLASTLTINPSLLPKPVKANALTKKTKPSELTSGSKVAEINPNRDAVQELREEISSIINRIAQEYLSMNPTSKIESNSTLPIASRPASPQGSTHSLKKGSTNAVPSFEKRNSTGLGVVEDPKTEFLNYLKNHGIFNEMKENLRPKINLIIKEKYGARGRALGKSDILKDLDTKIDDFGNPITADYNENVIESLLSELYVFLVQECNLVLNSIFGDTMINRDKEELEKNAYVNDQRETLHQQYKRLLVQAYDCFADKKYVNAENIYLECIQLINHEPTLGYNGAIVHEVYGKYGEFLAMQSANLRVSPPGQSIDVEYLQEKAYECIRKAREAMKIAYNANPNVINSSLLYVMLLVESNQEEQAEVIIHEILARELKSSNISYSLSSFDEFNGYNTDDLCPIDPKCYTILASLFSLQNSPIKARKALMLANRSYIEGNYKPPVSEHGSPRRTIVLILAETAITLFKFSIQKLGNECLKLAFDCDAAVTDKAKARGKLSKAIPHIQHLLKYAQSLGLQFSSINQTFSNQEHLERADESELVADIPEDKVVGTIAIAKSQLLLNLPQNQIIETFLSAAQIASTISIPSMVENNYFPLDSFITGGRLLLNAGRYEENLSFLLFGCSIYNSASLFLLVGITCLRLDQLKDAEDALIEANILDNRNAEVWANISLMCLTCGSYRFEEAEASLYQALRLGLNNSLLLRELATMYMSLDKLQIAEDLIRRAIANEKKQIVNPHTRKLLADILAGQNQTVKAIEGYQDIIGDESCDVKARIEAGESCCQLLLSIGRDDE